MRISHNSSGGRPRPCFTINFWHKLLVLLVVVVVSAPAVLVSAQEEEEEEVSFNASCESTLGCTACLNNVNDCVFAIGQCLSLCGPQTEGATCYTPESFPQFTVETICSLADQDNDLCTSRNSCAACTSSIKSDGSPCHWYQNGALSEGACYGGGCGPFGCGVTQCSAEIEETESDTTETDEQEEATEGPESDAEADTTTTTKAPEEVVPATTTTTTTEEEDSDPSSTTTTTTTTDTSNSAAAPDIIAVLPDRSTAYPNGVHNGLLLTARRLKLTIQVLDVGNFDPVVSQETIQKLIDMPTEQQPKIYCIWPIDFPAREQLQTLYQTHKIPIVQMNQLPSAEWEWDHLLGYAGPDDALRASNAGIMMRQALLQENDSTTKNIVALGYPESYGGYHLSIAAFEAAIQQAEDTNNNDNTTTSTNSNKLNLMLKKGLDWGTQPAYNEVLQLLDEHHNQGGPAIHGIYAMDDSILMGAYQALEDYYNKNQDYEVILVGTVCNGARELLETGAQYGTTVQGPYLEGDLAIRTAKEYLETGNVTNRIRFTPNPIITAESWSDLFIDFHGQSYTADQLCTWSLFYERVAGVTEESIEEGVLDDDSICANGIVDCKYIPTVLIYTGYILCSVNYFIAIVSGILLYVYQKKQVIQLAQPFFLGLVVFGSMVDNTSIIFMSRDNNPDQADAGPSLDASCFIFPWLLSLGHMMTTATLVAKIYRVKKLVGMNGSKRGLRKVKVTVAEVCVFIALFMSIDAILLIAWSATDPLHWELKISNLDQQGYVNSARGQCGTNDSKSFLYPLVIALVHLGTLIYANVLAYQTSDYHKISDSKSVAIALFNSIQLLVIVTPLLIVVDDNVAISYFLRVCFVFLNNFGVLCLVVVPKLYQCVLGLGHLVPDLHDIARASTANAAAKRGNRSSIRVSGISGPSSVGSHMENSFMFESNMLPNSRHDSNISNSNAADSNPSSAPPAGTHAGDKGSRGDPATAAFEKPAPLWTKSGFEVFSEVEKSEQFERDPAAEKDNGDGGGKLNSTANESSPSSSRRLVIVGIGSDDDDNSENDGGEEQTTRE